jgi:probable phosphoglycerate mutase
MTTIYLLRHGEIPASSPRRFLGRTDLPLTENGRGQIKELGRFLQSRAIGAIFSSYDK